MKINFPNSKELKPVIDKIDMEENNRKNAIIQDKYKRCIEGSRSLLNKFAKESLEGNKTINHRYFPICDDGLELIKNQFENSGYKIKFEAWSNYHATEIDLNSHNKVTMKFYMYNHVDCDYRDLPYSFCYNRASPELIKRLKRKFDIEIEKAW